MKNNTRKLLISAGIALATMAASGAQASTVIGSSFTSLQGNNVTWTATVDTGISLVQQICCALPGNQGDGTILNLVNAKFGTSFGGNVGKQDSLSGFAVNWTGPAADIFAIHFGGAGGGNELLIALSGNTSILSFSMTGTPGQLSSLQGFGAPTVTPLPAALPLFATGLAALGLFGWRMKRKAAAVAA